MRQPFFCDAENYHCFSTFGILYLEELIRLDEKWFLKEEWLLI